MSKFKATIDKQFLASDGTAHKTREAHEKHERKILVDRIVGYEAADFDAAVLGNNLDVATDVILLASLMRPPRAKRKGQSEAGPTAGSGADSAENAANSGAGTKTSVAGPIASADADQPSAEAPEAHDGQGDAAATQPEAAGASPAAVASDSPDARAPSEQEAHMDAYQYGTVGESVASEESAGTAPGEVYGKSHKRRVVGHARTAPVEA